MNVQSCLPLCDFMDCSPPGFSVPGIFQARILEWVAISYSRASSWPRDQTVPLASPALAGGIFATVPPGSLIKSVLGGYSRREGVLFLIKLCCRFFKINY